jgi:chaperone required for assembly of F1-ATPase
MADEKTAGKRRRFYERVEVAPDGERFGVALDGRKVKTPGRNDLVVATQGLAQAIANEWDAQKEFIQPQIMPMTQISCTAIDRMPNDGGAVRESIVGYAGTDLLCYRTDQPADLATRQMETWQPVLDWLTTTLGAHLVSTTALIATDQDPAALDKIADGVAALDDHELAALAVLTQASGSFALAWALVHDFLDADAAADAAFLDEIYQSELWGQDREAEQRLAALRDDIHTAKRYLVLHKG